MQTIKTHPRQTERINRLQSTTKGLVPDLNSVQDQNGYQIPEASIISLREASGYEEAYTSKEEASKRALKIVHSLTDNNTFALARAVATQTYNSSWFSRENDVSFKLALANTLSSVFGVDGYQNTVWNTVRGKVGI